ncbi:MAG: Holliday junction branch migration protein RuvA [Clostridiales bacterium]|nr:Holliday junction branch migration protein RuvA [Clostridiales bacterium]
MYYSLRGKLIFTDGYTAAVECAGVGYLCTITSQTYAQLPGQGEEVLLYTHLSVREDAMELYGFSTLEERSCFKMLILVSGVGAKVAIAILSVLSPDQVAFAIMSGDSKTLTAAPGVGPKLAQRIVLELKDKFKKGSVEFSAGSLAAAVPMPGAKGNRGEAIQALAALGYAQSEAAAALADCSDEMTVEDLIRTGLKKLAMNL